MSIGSDWLVDLAKGQTVEHIDGLLYTENFDPTGHVPETVHVMERAKDFGATAVFFEFGRDSRPATPQALLFVSDGPEIDISFADTHRRLWSWGAVPLAYRITSGLVQLFRCAHKPEFLSRGKVVFKPFDTLDLLARIDKAWWDGEQLRNGSIWDDPDICRKLLSNEYAAQTALVEEVEHLYEALKKE